MNHFSFCSPIKFDFSIKSEQEPCWVEDSCLQFLPFIHSLLASRVSTEKSADNIVGVPLYVICCLALAAFNILFIFTFCHFDYYVSWHLPP